MEQNYNSPKLDKVQAMEDKRTRTSNDFSNLDFSGLYCISISIKLKEGTNNWAGDYIKKWLALAIKDMADDLVEKAKSLEERAYQKVVAEAYEELDELSDKAKIVMKQFGKEQK